MKVILSRKGFDSTYGGYPSPILPDNKMISFPIPYPNDNDSYGNLRHDDLSKYYEIMRELNKNIWQGNKKYRLSKDTKCHLDPDIYNHIKKRDKGWKPMFGQVDQAQKHLLNQGVQVNDLFLFFGWFKKTEYDNDGKLSFVRGAQDFHAIFGYLQIDKVLEIKKEELKKDFKKYPNWMRDHSHIKSKTLLSKDTNSIYIAREKLSWGNSIPGAGTFDFDKTLVLTKDGFSRSKWDLPDFFRDLEISYHSPASWKDGGYFKSADIGQEFVIEDNEAVEGWVKKLIEKNIENKCINKIKDILSELEYDSVVRINHNSQQMTCHFCKNRIGTYLFTIDYGGFQIACEHCLKLVRSELAKHSQVEVRG